ncbi:hypothetical protein L3Q82_008149 [Scortum barcoo]|uniref:Uncharacterized protein n=1 Tax=Scortum barcoo TaxID=214431 RepID=A0ACB8WHE3_9TELE|nr:hypothetical protein L3Q82_008149 [Scortum barcoo]
MSSIEKISRNWHKRWPEIDQPWLVEGTLNSEVIKTIRVLVSTYKAEQRNGKKGQRRKEKRQTELGVLELFEKEGQKLLKASKNKMEKLSEKIGKNLEEAGQLMAKANAPYSHMSPVKSPPPYEKDTKSTKVYPQLPVK